MKIPGLINLLSFYVVGLPLSAWLAFGEHGLDLGLPALWIGLDVGMSVMTCALTCYFLRLDWDFEAKKAQDLALRTRSPCNSPMAKDARRRSGAGDDGDGGEEEEEGEQQAGEREQLLSRDGGAVRQ